MSIPLNSISLEDDVGQPYLTPADFFKNGVPASIIVSSTLSLTRSYWIALTITLSQATTIVVTVGYALMRLLGL